MNKSIIFYNIDNDKMVILPVEKKQGIFEIFEKERLSELELSTIPCLDRLIPLIDEETFTVVFSDNSTPYKMNYNEWETLRSQQANRMIQTKINKLSLNDLEKERLKFVFNQFTEGMRIKYLGQKSWNSLYLELLDHLL